MAAAPTSTSIPTSTRPPDRVIYTCPGCQQQGPADRVLDRNRRTIWVVGRCQCWPRSHVAEAKGLPAEAWS